MKIGIIGTCAVAALALAGCGKKEAATSTAPETKPAATAANTAAAAPAADAGQVMLSVNGKTLTRGQVDADVMQRIAQQKVPEQYIEQAKKQFGEQIAAEFLQKTLLMEEVQKKGIKLTDADRAKYEQEFAQMTKNRPGAPKSFKEWAQKHPAGEAVGMKMVEEQLTIRKLIEQEIVSKVKVDAKKVDEMFQNVSSNYTAMVTKAASAEKTLKELKQQLSGLTGAALTNKFAELAGKYSDCPSGKQAGGDLGAFAHGQMVKEFDEVAFKSEPFKVSDLVKTQFGYHIIMVTKKIPAVAAKADKPAEPEKVQASHILIKDKVDGQKPTREMIENYLKQPEVQKSVSQYFDGLRKAAKIEAPGFKGLFDPPAAAKPSTAKPIESKPVQVKPAAKPAAAPAPAAKPAAPAAKPAAAPAPAAKPAAPAAKPAAAPAPAAKPAAPAAK